MRLILFKGPVESLNHFVDELDIQLQAMGHETLVMLPVLMPEQ